MLVIADGAVRVDHVRRADEELDVGPLSQREITVAQRVLCAASVAIIADDEKREVVRTDHSLRLDAEVPIIGDRPVMFLQGQHHVFPPAVGTRL